MDLIEKVTELAYLIRHIRNHDKREELTNKLLGKNRDKDRDKLKNDALIILEIESSRNFRNYQQPILL